MSSATEAPCPICKKMFQIENDNWTEGILKHYQKDHREIASRTAEFLDDLEEQIQAVLMEEKRKGNL
jgi:hypothetical protein